MDETSSGAGQAPPTAPPTAPTGAPLSAADARKTVWPLVFGILGIVWGAYSLLSGLFALTLAGVQASGLLDDVGAFDEVDFASAEGLLNIGVGMVMGVYLLVGAIGLVRRKPVGAQRVLRWAMITIPLTIAMFLLTWLVFGGWEDAKDAFGVVVAPVMFGFLGISLAPPALVVWWMRRPAIVAERSSWA